jgi:hypothetical protein
MFILLPFSILKYLLPFLLLEDATQTPSIINDPVQIVTASLEKK